MTSFTNPPEDLDPISGDFINDDTAPSLPEDDDDSEFATEIGDVWADAYLSSAEFRAMVM